MIPETEAEWEYWFACAEVKTAWTLSRRWCDRVVLDQYPLSKHMSDLLRDHVLEAEERKRRAWEARMAERGLGPHMWEGASKWLVPNTNL
jgi:hypothetical protein